MNTHYENDAIGASHNKSEPLNEDSKPLLPFDYEITDSKDTRNDTKRSIYRQMLNRIDSPPSLRFLRRSKMRIMCHIILLRIITIFKISADMFSIVLSMACMGYVYTH